MSVQGIERHPVAFGFGLLCGLTSGAGGLLALTTSRDRDVLGAWLTIGGPAVLVLGLVLAKIFRPGLRMF